VVADKNDKEKADVFAQLLNNLPTLFKDTDNLTSIILGQQKLIMQLENQMKYFASVIETLAVGKVQIEVSKELQEHITELAHNSNMYSQEGGEITFEVKSSMFSEKNELSSKDSKYENMNDSFKNFSGELGGLLDIIADLRISGNMQERTKTIKNDSNFSAKHEKEALTMSGKATYKYGQIKCDPSLPIIEKMRKNNDERLTPEFIAELKKNPHN
jgi:hypothetical protein